MSEENQPELDYIEEIVEKPKFARSNEAGYVEENVDRWVDDIRKQLTDLGNRYNNAIYNEHLATTALNEANSQIANLSESNQRLMSGKGGPTQEEHDAVVAELEAVKAQYNELLDNYEAVHARNSELEAQAGTETASEPAAAVAAKPTVIQSYDREVSAEDGYTYVLEYTEEGNVATVKEFPELKATGKNAEHALSNLMDDVDEILVNLQAEGKQLPQPGEYEETPAAAAVSSISLDTTKVEALMKAAADEAAEHVQRTQNNMLRLEEAARREAESIVADANREAEESREELARNRSESAAIRNRMVMLFESQLAEIKNHENSIGYDPTISPDWSQAGENE